MKVYFMRHGETDWNKAQRLQGSSDIPLNQNGIDLAQRTAEGVNAEGIIYDYCFSSPLVRAHETARIMTQYSNISPIVDARIQEISFGEYEGKCISDLRNGPDSAVMGHFFLDTENYVPDKNAESLEHLFHRLNDFWAEKILPLEREKEQVLVCCHGAVCRAFMVLLHPLPVADYWSNHQFNCSINCVEVKNGRAEVLYENKIYYDPSVIVMNPLLK